ncbi:hypothetical protein AK812_SmicGene27978 [Symbiodinium microadriaticum]|uniref:Uncharacterized protein n=1 Tax=Symbiodinium microadriaticum TaxID=2951 RepID=A0A1Q9D5J0_SYMMI|nr:hypothetical protein AK812_SmicGene27978 [Symbiodinium microadriaticum]
MGIIIVVILTDIITVILTDIIIVIIMVAVIIAIIITSTTTTTTTTITTITITLTLTLTVTVTVTVTITITTIIEDLLELRLQAEENLGLPYLPEPGMLPAWAEPILVVPHKVQRDIEQLEYLVSKGRLDSEMENYVAEFALPEFRTALQLVSQALEGTADDSAVIDPNEHLAVFFGLHNRHLHLHPGTKLPGPVVNTELDLQEAQRSFAEQKQPGRRHRAVVIDNFLSEHALQVLRDFLLESTIWTDVKRGKCWGEAVGKIQIWMHRYVGAYLQTGLASSLIVQVAETLEGFPGVDDANCRNAVHGSLKVTCMINSDFSMCAT